MRVRKVNFGTFLTIPIRKSPTPRMLREHPFKTSANFSQFLTPTPLPRRQFFTTIRRQIWQIFDPSPPKKCQHLKWMVSFLIFFSHLHHQVEKTLQIDQKGKTFKVPNIFEIFEIFEVRVQIGSDLLFIPWDFFKSRILNIRKVQIRSNIKCFEFFGQTAI